MPKINPAPFALAACATQPSHADGVAKARVGDVLRLTRS
jgi:hypothetical protein